ncbi:MULTISPECIES: hypothetical protein [unclassified Micromonospora]|uniref:hypothetical protein n=1 Tax=unclassified Micromonospora TaxID=2617518 RepID=UPI0033A450A7
MSVGENIQLRLRPSARLTVAGHLGGELVHRYGVHVADETIRAQGHNSTDKENS